MTNLRMALFAAIALLWGSLAARAADNTAEAEVRGALTQWMTDFNDGKEDKVCDLFAPDLRANFRGVPERGYEGQCDLLKTALADQTRTFSYAVDIEEILMFDDIVIVRLVWTLSVAPKDGAPAMATPERGLDVFRKQPDGHWRIMRYIAYEEDWRAATVTRG